MTWQQIAQCTLSAAQQATAASASASDTLQQRMVLNHDLDRAFIARKNRQPWKTYDGPTLLIAAEDLIAAEQALSCPHGATGALDARGDLTGSPTEEVI